MASFENLGEQNSLRSGSTSTVGETRDLSRQSEQRARVDHRRAIQVRKVAFLVLVLLLLVGGLSYAIYKVVSNKSDENETARAKLAKDKMSSSMSAPRSNSVIKTAKQSLSDTSGASKTALNPTSLKQVLSTPTMTHLNNQLSSMSLLNHNSSDKVASIYHSMDKSTKIFTSFTKTMHPKQSVHSLHHVSSNMHDSTASSNTFVAYITQPNNQMPMRSTPPLRSFSTLGLFWEHTQSSAIKMESEITSTKDFDTVTTKTSVVEKETLSTSVVQVDHSTTRPSSTINHSMFSDKSSKHSNSVYESSMDSKLLPSEKSTSDTGILSDVSYSRSSEAASTLHDRQSYSTVVLPTSNFSINPSAIETIPIISNISNHSVTYSTSTVRAISSSNHSEMARNILPTTTLLNPSMVVNRTMTINSSELIDQSNVISSLYSTQIIPSTVSSSSTPSSSVWLEPFYYLWGNWSTCSLKCGGGYTSRIRKCSQENSCGSLGSNINISTCNMHKCNETTFKLSVNLTEIPWQDDYYNTSSLAYQWLVDHLMKQLLFQYGPNVTAEVDNVIKGSVIVSLAITFPETKTIQDLTSMIDDGKLGNLSISVITIVNNMVPLKPSYVTAQNTTTNSTVVHWTGLHLNETNGILLGYKMLLNPGNRTLNIENPKETNLLPVTNLLPETTYTIQFFGYNINGDGIKRNVTFKTKELPPHYLSWAVWSNCSRSCGGGITTRTRNCSKEGLCSHLGASEQREHCNVIKCEESSYSVEMNVTNAEWTDDLKNTSSQAYKAMVANFLAALRKKYPNATFVFGNITQGSVIIYFTMTLPKEDSTSGETLTEELETDGVGNYTINVKKMENNNLPKRPPGGINITLITHHSAMIDWLRISEEDSNGAIIGYTIVFYSSILNKTTEYNLSVKASDTEFQYELTKLVPNTSYHFHMYGYNINGKGMYSKKIQFATKVQIPKINSLNVSHITTHNAVFYWTIIPDNNVTYGIIMGYKVLRSSYNEMNTTKVSASEGSVVLHYLSANMVYNVTVLGFNDYGDGVISDIFYFKTMVQIPKINSLNISHITTHNAVFYWTRIADNNVTYGIIMGYKVILFSYNEMNTVIVSANEGSVTLHYLSANTMYSVTVFGFNEYGDGVTSDIFDFKTMVQIPKINSLNVSHITTHNAVFYWTRIPDNVTYGIIMGYKVILSSYNEMNTTKVSASERSVALHYLSANTMYNVTVLGFNDYGDGVISDIFHFKTMVLKDKETENLTTSLSLLQMSSSHQLLPSAFSQHTSTMDYAQFKTMESLMISPTIASTHSPTTTKYLASPHVTVSSSVSLSDKLKSTVSSPTNTRQASTQPPQADKTYIVGKIHLVEKEWDSELANPKSQIFNDLKENLQNALTALFMENNVENFTVEVYGFSSGSVNVYFFVMVANYDPENITHILLTNSQLNNEEFTIKEGDFLVKKNVKPTMEPVSNNVADKGMQKNNDDDDSALIVAVVMCTLLAVGAAFILIYIGKKRKWFNRSRRKVVPEDDDEDDLYPGPQTDRKRLAKSARRQRKVRGARINGGHNTTEF